ncbi:MAG: Rieske (2Fe-2S) protein [Dermatophilaceae bacterium]
MRETDGGTPRRRVLQATGGALAAATLSACGGASESPSSPPGTTLHEAAAATVKTTDVPLGGGVILTDAKVVVTQPAAGEFKAFSAICTHQHCPVADVTTTIDCTCHNSHFSITDGSVVSGPARSPLPARTTSVSGDTITVS